jgi:hypothetical protein
VHPSNLTHPKTRNFAAVLFRRQSSKPRKNPATDKTADLFLSLQQGEREAIRAKLLECLASENEARVRSKIADAVAELARQHTDEGEIRIACLNRD